MSTAHLTELNEQLVYSILEFLDSLSLSRSAQTCYLLQTLATIILHDKPHWTTLTMKAVGSAVDSDLLKILPEEVRGAQGRVGQAFNTVFMFPTLARRSKRVTDEDMLDVKKLEAMLPKTCMGIGCAAHEITGVSTDSFAKGAMQGSYDTTSGSLSLANFPDCVRMVFNVSSVTSAEAALAQTPTMPGEGDWKVIMILSNGSGDIQGYIEALEKRHPGAEIIGGFHGNSHAYMIDQGKLTTPTGIVGMCIGGNVVYSSQISRACKPLSDVYEITKCQADEEDAAVNEVTLGDKKASGAQYVQEAFNELQKGPSPARMMFFGVTEDVEKGFELANIHGLDRHGSVHVTRPRTEGDLVGTKTRLFTLDIVSSKADVAARLKAAKRKAEGQSKEVLGSILVTCGGRSTGFYGEPAVEAGIFQEQLGGVGMSGFFSGGEIGPDARGGLPYDSDFRGKTEIQGFTSVFGVFFVPTYKPTWEVMNAKLMARMTT